jgi:hypothetical protein
MKEFVGSVGSVGAAEDIVSTDAVVVFVFEWGAE